MINQEPEKTRPRPEPVICQVGVSLHQPFPETFCQLATPPLAHVWPEMVTMSGVSQTPGSRGGRRICEMINEISETDNL